MIPARAMSFGRSAALALFACLAGPAAVAAVEVINRIVATVDGEPITAHEVRRYAEERHAREVDKQALLDAVITEKILEREIAVRKITAKKEDVDNYVAEVLARNKLTEEQFVKALKQQGLTLEKYRARIKREIERTQLVGQELRGEVTVTDDDIRRYYQEHKDEFAERAGVTVRDIFFPFKPEMTRADAMRLVEQAKAVKRMADAGQSFAELARRHSQGPGAESGGLLGTFRRGEMEPQLEQAAFALPVGVVSPPVMSPTGVHLLKVESAISGGAVPFDEVKDDIRQVLVSRALDDRFKVWIDTNVRARHHVEVIN